ncbi:hypothetical protein ACFL6U_02260 [Planctomycetota bacterium]
MAIVFHCEHCNKKIEAPDNIGGKRGKCPSCHNRVYVPAPVTEDDEELRLAPLDDEAEKQRQKLAAAALNLTEQLMKEKIAPEISSDEVPPADVAGLGFIQMPTVDDNTLTKTIVQHLHLMAEGELDEAEKLVTVIGSQPKQANLILEQIGLNQIADPKLAGIPPQVLAGLIRQLRSQIG